MFLKHITHIIVILAILTFPGSVSAQGTWTSFTNANDIKDMEIHGEYLWCATYSGVYRYDGNNWKSYTVNDGLVSNRVQLLSIDSNDIIWIGTNNGVSRFDGHTWTTYTSNDGLVYNDVISIATESDGTIWFLTTNGVSRFITDYITVETPENTPTEIEIIGNFPNPFNLSTTITYSIGQKVATLFDGHRDTGTYSVYWDASGQTNGIYIAVMKAGGITKIEKMMLEVDDN